MPIQFTGVDTRHMEQDPQRKRLKAPVPVTPPVRSVATPSVVPRPTTPAAPTPSLQQAVGAVASRLNAPTAAVTAPAEAALQQAVSRVASAAVPPATAPAAPAPAPAVPSGPGTAAVQQAMSTATAPASAPPVTPAPPAAVSAPASVPVPPGAPRPPGAGGGGGGGGQDWLRPPPGRYPAEQTPGYALAGDMDRLYQGLLGRSAAEGDYQAQGAGPGWQTRTYDNTNGRVWNNLVASILNSSELRSKYAVPNAAADPTAQARAWIQGYLGRDMTDADRAALIPHFQRGGLPAVQEAILRSDEMSRKIQGMRMSYPT